MDLTLESIRRHYRAASSPLADVLARYRDFFAAFEDFRGYVDFWLLQDMVTDDDSAVRFFTPVRARAGSPARVAACLSLFARRDSEHRSPALLLLSQRSGAITAGRLLPGAARTASHGPCRRESRRRLPEQLHSGRRVRSSRGERCPRCQSGGMLRRRSRTFTPPRRPGSSGGAVLPAGAIRSARRRARTERPS